MLSLTFSKVHLSIFISVLQRQYSMIYVSYLTDNCFCLISAGRKPSVAAIDGLTIGGGLEVAMVRMC